MVEIDAKIYKVLSYLYINNIFGILKNCIWGIFITCIVQGTV